MRLHSVYVETSAGRAARHCGRAGAARSAEAGGDLGQGRRHALGGGLELSAKDALWKDPTKQCEHGSNLGESDTPTRGTTRTMTRLGIRPPRNSS